MKILRRNDMSISNNLLKFSAFTYGFMITGYLGCEMGKIDQRTYNKTIYKNYEKNISIMSEGNEMAHKTSKFIMKHLEIEHQKRLAITEEFTQYRAMVEKKFNNKTKHLDGLSEFIILAEQAIDKTSDLKASLLINNDHTGKKYRLTMEKAGNMPSIQAAQSIEVAQSRETMTP